MRVILFIFLISLYSCSNKTNNGTEVTIIGTVHFPTDYVNADSIYMALQQMNPDIIAMEADSSVFNADFTFKKTYDENEYNAVLKYLKGKPETMVRPIGFEGRNAYRKKIGVYSEAGFVYGAMYDLLDKEELSKEQSDMLLHYEDLWGAMEVFKNETLSHINNSFVDRLIDSVNSYQYVKTKAIVDENSKFNYKIIGSNKDSITLKEYFKKWTHFEGIQRNDALAGNLKRLIKKYPNKRIVALTGFKHRSYVINSLKASTDLAIDLKEFYEYENL